MRLVIVGIVACAALGLAVVSYRRARAVEADIAGLRDELRALSAEAALQRGTERVVRTVIDQRLVPSAEVVASVTAPPPESSAAERFERDAARDPRRRADVMSVMDEARLEVDSVECNATMCAIEATTSRVDAAQFVDAVSEALGPGFVLEMVYNDAGPEHRRIIIYAR